MVQTLLRLVGQHWAMIHGHAIGDLTDALGDIRSQIRALKAQEADLRRAILDARPNGQVTGGRFILQIRRGTSKRIDPKALPNHIRDDPRYWTEKRTQTLVTRQRKAEPAIAITPMGLAEKAPVRTLVEDEFDVFEPF